MIWKFISLFLVIALVSGCRNDVAEIEEQSSVIALLLLFFSLAYLYILPKLQTWSLSQKFIDVVIVKLAYCWIVIMGLSGIYCLFVKDPIGLILSISLFVTSALVIRMKIDYDQKTDHQKLSDLRYVTFTIPTNLVLIFLFNDGLEKILG